jgi:hypothetical protein
MCVSMYICAQGSRRPLDQLIYLPIYPRTYVPTYLRTYLQISNQGRDILREPRFRSLSTP